MAQLMSLDVQALRTGITGQVFVPDDPDTIRLAPSGTALSTSIRR